MIHGRSFEFTQTVPFPREEVYEVFRDRSRELIPLLPNVESVTVLERTEIEPGRHRIVNRWQGKPTAVPRIIQPFLKPELTRWMDYAEWSDKEHCVRWRFEMPQVKDLFTCGGVNWFEADGKGTLVRFCGTVTLYPERVPGIPKLLAGRIAVPLERWLLGLLKPNMLEVPVAVSAFLSDKAENR